MLVKREERPQGEIMTLKEFLAQAEMLYGLVTGNREESSVAQATWEGETVEGDTRPFLVLVAAYGGAAGVISETVKRLLAEVVEPRQPGIPKGASAGVN